MNNTIPNELTSRPQWLKWYETDDGGKRPIGKSNDPATWCEYEDIATHDRIAFVIDGSDPYTGIDLDGCITNGEFDDWATEILNRFKGLAYCEVSPSGKGVKLLTRGKKPDSSRCTHKIGEGKTQVECYDFARFWTITKQTLKGFESIGDGQAAVDWLCDKYLKTEQPNRVEQGGNLSHLNLNPVGTSSLHQRAQAYADKVPPSSSGSRNNDAFRLAGNLNAIVGEYGERLTDGEVLSLVRYWNLRNPEPLADNELLTLVASARVNGTPRADKVATPAATLSSTTVYPPGTTTFTDDQYDKIAKTYRLEPVWSLGKLLEADLKESFIVNGVLIENQPCLMGGAFKTLKTTIALDLAMSLCSGASS